MSFWDGPGTYAVQDIQSPQDLPRTSPGHLVPTGSRNQSIERHILLNIYVFTMIRIKFLFYQQDTLGILYLVRGITKQQNKAKVPNLYTTVAF